jgi:hypothetical protein
LGGELMMRTFPVGTYVGRKVAGWPFGRLDVSETEVSVRCWPFAWFTTRSVAKENVAGVSVKRKMARSMLTIDDSAGDFAGVSVEISVGAGKIIDEFKRCGYPVHDNR